MKDDACPSLVDLERALGGDSLNEEIVTRFCHARANEWILSSSSSRVALAVVDGTGRFKEHGPHYSRRTPGSKTFTGVGAEIVLVTRDDAAVWAIVYQRTPSARGTGGSRGRTGASDTKPRFIWRNMMFRNLSLSLSLFGANPDGDGSYVRGVGEEVRVSPRGAAPDGDRSQEDPLSEPRVFVQEGWVARRRGRLREALPLRAAPMITVIRSDVKIRQFVVFDLEWHPKTLKLRLIGLDDGQRYRHWDAERLGQKGAIAGFMREVLTRKYENKWIFAHWGGATDLCFFLAFFLEHGFQVDLRFSGSSAVFCEVRKGRRKWRFCDSFFLLRAPLRAIMEKIGMKKGGAEGEEEIFTAKMSELREYNANDCRGLYVAVDRFQDRMRAMGGEMMPTIAATAMRLFRRKYLRHDIHTDGQYNLIARQAYASARVEVFKKRIENAYQYDFNSSFPSSMLLPAPGSFKETAFRVPKEGDLFLVDCTFQVPECPFPPIPFRAGGKVFFPTGTWRQWLSGVDFRVLERHGKIDQVHEVLLYEGNDDMAGYVREIYEHRRQAIDAFDREIDKLLMNSLYGKWAERADKFVVILGSGRDVQSFLDEGLDADELFPGAIRVMQHHELEHEHVPFSEHVTAHSRTKLLHLLHQAPDAAYCDCDSGTSSIVLPVSDRLGDIKREKDIHVGRYHAAKFYTTDGTDDKGRRGMTVKAKGFSKILDDETGKQRKLTPADFDKLVAGGSVTMERMARPREMLRDVGLKDEKKRKALDPRLSLIEKRLATFDEKRCFSPDGSESRPWSVTELLAKYGV